LLLSPWIHPQLTPMIKEAAAAAAAAAAQRVKSVLRASFAGQFAIKGGQDNSERLQGDHVRWMREGGVLGLQSFRSSKFFK
jgi:hypothetical protein